MVVHMLFPPGSSPIWQRPSKFAIDPLQCRSDSSSDEEEDTSSSHSPSQNSRFLGNLLPRDSKLLNKWGPLFGEDEDLNLAIQESLIADPQNKASQPLDTVRYHHI